MDNHKFNLLTPYEHEIMGSTPANTVEEISRYSQNPHMPLALQDELLSVDECSQQRLEMQSVNAMICDLRYWGINKIGTDTTFSIEGLNTDPDHKYHKHTVRDPALLSVNGRGDLQSGIPLKFQPRHKPDVRLEND